MSGRPAQPQVHEPDSVLGSPFRANQSRHRSKKEQLSFLYADLMIIASFCAPFQMIPMHVHSFFTEKLPHFNCYAVP